MEVVCDTSFLMVVCYKPVKNMDITESRIGKIIFLIHSDIISELSRIGHSDGIKRAKIANLSLEVIKSQIKKGNFKYTTSEINSKAGTGSKIQVSKDVDSFLLSLAFEKKCPLATIDKNLIKRALRKGVDIVTLRDNKIIFIASKIDIRSNLNYSD